jgi:YHS domain-containing protein
MRPSTRTFPFLLLTALLAAKDPVSPVNLSGGLAVKGYDVVAYFEKAMPVKGSSAFETQWNGATWRFSRAEHKEKFVADPPRYAPQFGGYCAWAVSNNYTAGIDPEAWKIVEGKLYLNYSKSVQRMWERDLENRIRLAEQNWPKLHR